MVSKGSPMGATWFRQGKKAFGGTSRVQITALKRLWKTKKANDNVELALAA
jgi:hypothetical protein